MRHYITTSLFTLALATSFAQAQSTNDGIYALEQAAAGKQIYQRECAVCHGAGLTGGEGGIALVGSTFLENWLGKPYAALDHKTRTTMPVVNPNGLSVSDSVPHAHRVLQL